jgi:uncharacterized protein YjcR
LVDKSTGICTGNDPNCNPAIVTFNSKLKEEGLQSPKQTITEDQAYDICQTYINTYLNKSQRKRNIQLKSTIDDIMNECVDGLIFTGDAAVSQIL